MYLSCESVKGPNLKVENKLTVTQVFWCSTCHDSKMSRYMNSIKMNNNVWYIVMHYKWGLAMIP